MITIAEVGGLTRDVSEDIGNDDLVLLVMIFIATELLTYIGDFRRYRSSCVLVGDVLTGLIYHVVHGLYKYNVGVWTRVWACV